MGFGMWRPRVESWVEDDPRRGIGERFPHDCNGGGWSEGQAETKPAGRKGSSSSSSVAEEDDDGTALVRSANPRRGCPRARLPLLRRSGSPPSSVGCAPGSRRLGEGRSGSSPRPRPRPRRHHRPRCGLPLLRLRDGCRQPASTCNRLNTLVPRSDT
uniref:Uncharacterized protein n=1 Tax=Oryza meridionalis TaxID=40149 RepID=A0A0E0F4R0_9ORYZ